MNKQIWSRVHRNVCSPICEQNERSLRKQLLYADEQWNAFKDAGNSFFIIIISWQQQ